MLPRLRIDARNHTTKITLASATASPSDRAARPSRQRRRVTTNRTTLATNTSMHAATKTRCTGACRVHPTRSWLVFHVCITGIAPAPLRKMSGSALPGA